MKTPRQAQPRWAPIAAALALGVSSGSCGGGRLGPDEFGDPGPIGPNLARADVAPAPDGGGGPDNGGAGDAASSQQDAGAAGGGGAGGKSSGNSGGSGGTKSGGAGTGGGGGTGGGAGAGGVGDAGTVADAASSLPDVCPAAPGSQAASCLPSLVINPTFERDEASWVSDGFATQSFDATKDGRASSASGSLQVSNINTVDGHEGLVMAGSRQCIPVSAGISYDLSAQFFLPSTGAAPFGVALGLRFFTAASCAGSAAAAFVTPASAVADKWSFLRLLAAAPAGTQSMSVHLLVEKSYRQASMSASFDNILLRSF